MRKSTIRLSKIQYFSKILVIRLAIQLMQIQISFIIVIPMKLKKNVFRISIIVVLFVRMIFQMILIVDNMKVSILIKNIVTSMNAKTRILEILMAPKFSLQIQIVFLKMNVLRSFALNISVNPVVLILIYR